MADFARDLGYLDKFFATLRAHAGTMDAAAGARLLALVDGEVNRWQEIRALLAGQASTPTAPAATAAATAAAAATEAPAGVRPSATPGRRMRRTLTVGSLITRR